jgi:hypothetical protein
MVNIFPLQRSISLRHRIEDGWAKLQASGEQLQAACQRFQAVREELEVTRLQIRATRSQVRAAHLPAKRRASDAQKTIQERAFLTQMRLELEAQIEAVRS